MRTRRQALEPLVFVHLPEIIERHMAGKTLKRVLMLATVRKQNLGNSVPVWHHKLDDRPEIIAKERPGHWRFFESMGLDENSPIGMPKPLYGTCKVTCFSATS